jgi:hypothetical protein
MANPKNRTRLERELVILLNEEEEMAEIGTTSPMFCRRLTKRLGKPTLLSPGSWSWTVPKSFIQLPRRKSVRKKKEESNGNV